MITQGKWESTGVVIQDTKDPIFYHADVISNGTVRVAKSSGIGKEESLANARLIAAAPDLLEACKMLLNNFEAIGGKCGIEVATDAIAKAEGN